MNRIPFHLLFFTGALLWSGAAWGYSPDPWDIYNQLAQQTRSVKRAVIETKTIVYAQPSKAVSLFGGNKEAEENLLADPEKSYKQTIYWLRDTFIAIETSSLRGEPLHFFYRDNDNRISKNLTTNRRFTNLDVVTPNLLFMEENPQKIAQGLAEWGIHPLNISLERTAGGQLFYRLGKADEGELVLENESMLPVKMETWVEGATPPLHLEVEFGDVVKVGLHNRDEKNLFFPRTVNFLLDHKMFKQTLLVKFDRLPPTTQVSQEFWLKKAQTFSQKP